MKIISVVGARPQFIKAAVVSREIKKRSELEEVIVHTGQHYDDNMSEIFFNEMEIPKPDYNLGIGSGSHGWQTGKMLESMEDVFVNEKPQMALVYGDTNSTLAGALAAVKLNIPVAHIEAGLRSFNRRMPEEINRILTDHASDLLFAPTKLAMANLDNEGIPAKQCFLVGDVMYDAALFYAKKAEQISTVIENLGLSQMKYILSTIHRAENTDDSKRLKVIVEVLLEIADSNPVILPLHPRTQAALEREGLFVQVEKCPKIINIRPVGYLDMIMLEKNATLVVTDSGGVQKEAYFYKVPCVTLREETEWVELIEIGWNKLSPPIFADQVLCDIAGMIDNKREVDEGCLYGQGKAGNQIANVIQKVL